MQFADLCWWSLSRNNKESSSCYKNTIPLGCHVARNAKAIIFCVLESITVEHMQALDNKMPGIAHILISLCWQVVSAMLDFLFKLPENITLSYGFFSMFYNLDLLL